MTIFHSFSLKIETSQAKMVEPILENINTNSLCIYVWFTFSDIKPLLGESRILEIQLCAINHKCLELIRVSWNFVIMASKEWKHNYLDQEINKNSTKRILNQWYQPRQDKNRNHYLS